MNLLVYLFVPVLIVISIALGTFLILEHKDPEAFFAGVMYQAIVMSLEVTSRESRTDGCRRQRIKAVLPAIMILA